MAQIEHDWRLSFSLSAAKQGETKKAEPDWLLPCFRSRVGAPVALQQSRTLRTSFKSLPLFPYTPSSRGHLYFAIQGTFLFCIDTKYRANCWAGWHPAQLYTRTSISLVSIISACKLPDDNCCKSA
jgi:hypothetical protein